MPSPRVAVVDIGSNSIKVLVAERTLDGTIAALHARTLDARISAGISRSNPRLTEASMERGLSAIRELLDGAAPFAPDRYVLVATSAVRDAENGEDFRARVQASTHHEIRILTGKEEAGLIGRGLTCDPALAGLSDFYVFDLGGGSLECLAFRDRRIDQAVSLQLGCVRLSEKWVAEPERPIATSALEGIQSQTKTEVARAGFRFALASNATAVGCGGTVTTIRTILAARSGRSLDKTPTRVEVDQLRSLLLELSALTLSDRKKVSGLPPARADIFPTALATLIAVAEQGGFPAYQHSFYNLRYGLAAEVFDTL
ncbi:MAG: phosphatase [Opitutus sp.]